MRSTSPLLALLLCGTLTAPAHSAPRSAPTTLADAIDYFRDITHANFDVNWKVLEAAGIARDEPVQLSLKNVTLRTALKKTLDAAAPGQLTFYVDQNVIHVTTVADADTHLITRVYPVGDLLVAPPDFAGPDLSLNQSGGGSRTGGSGGGSSSSSGSLFSNAVETAIGRGDTVAQRGAALVELIQSTVRPEVWTANGGKATIRFFHDNLIVTAPPSVQDLLD